MTIGEIIDCLNRRESIAIIAKRLEISPYTLSKKLRLIDMNMMENRKAYFCRRWRRTASLTTPRSDSPSICENGLSTINL